MAEGDAPHSEEVAGGRSRRRGALLRRTTGAAVVVVLALALVSFLLDSGGRFGSAPDPRTAPGAVAPPAGLDLPAEEPAGPVAARLPDGRIDPRAVRRALGSLTAAPRLGRRVAVVVAGLDGVPVVRRGVDRVTPASTMKLLTTLAALEALGPEHRFVTRVVGTGRRLTLVGGGDPLLASSPQPDGTYPERADLATLARRTAARLKEEGRTRVRLGYDAGLFTGPAVSPFWEDDYLPDDVVSPISALWVDEGRERAGFAARSADPAAAAARAFAGQLRRRGIAVGGGPTPATAPAGAEPVAEVRSAELVEIVQHVLEVSDNEGAEVLARQVALAEGEPASFAGAARAVRAVLRRLDVPLAGAVIHDGSGLARSDRLAPETLLRVLALSADPARPELAGVVAGLPVAGFSGSLAYRFDTRADAGLGWVRAKTGTLTGVHALAGLVVGRDGAVMTYVAVADRVRVPNTLFARARLDQVSAALAACSCGRRG